MSDSTCTPANTSLSGDAERRATKLRVILAYSLCALIWGTTWYLIRVCIGPSGYPVYPAAALRFSISSALLAIAWMVLRKKIPAPSRGITGWILLAGILSGISYGLLYRAETAVSGGVAAVVSAIGPLVTAMIAMVTRTEKPLRTTILGSLIALVGVTIVFYDRLQISAEQASAVGLLLMCSSLNGSSNVVMKRHVHNVHALATNTMFFFAASVSLWIAAAVTGQFYVPYPLPFGPTAALLYLTFFGTLLSFAMWFYMMKHVRLSTSMTLACVTPIIALIVDAFFEKHAELTLESYIGAAVVILGVTTTVFFKARSDK